MPVFVIAIGTAPHMKLSQHGREFSATDVPMVFESHNAAYDYLVQHNENKPLKGVRSEIVEDLSR